MIKEFANAWDIHKDELKAYIRTHHMGEYAENYRGLVYILFEKVINPEMDEVFDYCPFELDDLVVLDHGAWSGTQVFILHKNSYEPYIDDYVYTYVYYGSCSGCDTLLGITTYESGLPNEQQVEDLMTLCLHLLQHCHWMKDKEE